jgi:hypothetical protein
VIVIPQKVYDELNELYPRETYIGKAFEISRRKAEVGKKPYLYTMYEIVPD